MEMCRLVCVFEASISLDCSLDFSDTGTILAQSDTRLLSEFTAAGVGGGSGAGIFQNLCVNQASGSP